MKTQSVTFLATAILSCSSGMASLTAVHHDLTGDGVVDHITIDSTASGSIMIQDGDSGITHQITPGSALGISPQFGYSVSAISDLNGDGVSDLVIGAPTALTEGRAFVFFSPISSSLSTDDAAITLTPPAAATRSFGFAVAPFPDSNGDSHPDIRVRAFVVHNNRQTEDVTFVFDSDTGQSLGGYRGNLGRDSWRVIDEDLDDDGDVDADDVTKVIDKLGVSPALPRPSDEDLNDDGIVDMNDLVDVLINLQPSAAAVLPNNTCQLVNTDDGSVADCDERVQPTPPPTFTICENWPQYAMPAEPYELACPAVVCGQAWWDWLYASNASCRPEVFWVNCFGHACIKAGGWYQPPGDPLADEDDDGFNPFSYGIYICRDALEAVSNAEARCRAYAAVMLEEHFHAFDDQCLGIWEEPCDYLLCTELVFRFMVVCSGLMPEERFECAYNQLVAGGYFDRLFATDGACADAPLQWDDLPPAEFHDDFKEWAETNCVERWLDAVSDMGPLPDCDGDVEGSPPPGPGGGEIGSGGRVR